MDTIVEMLGASANSQRIDVDLVMSVSVVGDGDGDVGLVGCRRCNQEGVSRNIGSIQTRHMGYLGVGESTLAGSAAAADDGQVAVAVAVIVNDADKVNVNAHENGDEFLCG